MRKGFEVLNFIYNLSARCYFICIGEGAIMEGFVACWHCWPERGLVK